MRNPVRNQRTGRGATRPTKGNQLRIVRRVLKVFVAVVLLSGFGFGTLQGLSQINQPVKEIQLSGEFDSRWTTEIEAKLDSYAGVGLMAIDMDQLKAEIESTAWVSQARVSRQWPATLAVNLEEHRLVARWNFDGYVSDQGILVRGYEIDQSMPLLQSSAAEPLTLLQQYRRLSQAMSQVNLQLAELHESRTGDLSLLLDNGIYLKLGNRDLLGRIQRFIAVWELDLHQRVEQINGIDVRYAKGLAVNWNRSVVEVGNGAGVEHLGEKHGQLAGR
jgi:cell division protein FtsQ